MGGWKQSGRESPPPHRPLTTCSASSVAALGSGPAVFCTSGSRWTDSCSPPAASCAPAPGATCSAGPSRPGPARPSAPSCNAEHSRQGSDSADGPRGRSRTDTLWELLLGEENVSSATFYKYQPSSLAGHAGLVERPFIAVTPRGHTLHHQSPQSNCRPSDNGHFTGL